MIRKTIYLPVENQVRELDAKLLFAAVAANRGNRTVLGNKQFLYFSLPDHDPGVFIAKSMRGRSKLMFDIIRGLGHHLVAWDEESLVRFQSPEYYAWRFSSHTFNAVTDLFAWGADDADMFAAYPQRGQVRIHQTGNPRSDLLRPELRDYFAPTADAISAQRGDFILVNTNFSFVNPFLKATALIRNETNGRTRISRTGTGLSVAFAQRMFAHQAEIFAHFKVLMAHLAERFSDHLIVLRPHPSENHEVWREILRPFSNIEVCHDGNVVPWLMAAKVLIHNGCTTAVEAAQLGQAVVSYQPVRDAELDYHLPNGVSRSASTVVTVLDAVAEALDSTSGFNEPAERAQYIARHLCATEGPMSSERILDVIEALPTQKKRKSRRIATLVSSLRTAIKRRNMQRPEHWASGRYVEHRFPDLECADIRERLERLRGVYRIEQPLQIEDAGEQVFAVSG